MKNVVITASIKDTLHVEALPGAPLHALLHEALSLARKKARPVRLDVRGIEIIVSKADCIEMLIQKARHLKTP